MGWHRCAYNKAAAIDNTPALKFRIRTIEEKTSGTDTLRASTDTKGRFGDKDTRAATEAAVQRVEVPPTKRRARGS